MAGTFRSGLSERCSYWSRRFVEVLKSEVFEVEFSDDEGRAYASVALKAEQRLLLHYEPVETGS